ncbi:protein SERAC1 [Marchantia polymorpha subsp. ruderalis]|uniref:DUF676 domain-containing protein n=2 Tax=Marchantia polymorpha TaxID=3197 RepID=A0AAF6BE03_MARPO|nr:hypothetical protein MARPO_0397s0001 [Marchantia polymorpha]BBN10237.1 hypothetical protein Mp_5g02060 [Marchantia polymorpha subsp. ruderalis]|eukprot:PTQ26779.1 hypothetical protein MARPO_0397s0001 [Marchantia polymorpha]
MEKKSGSIWLSSIRHLRDVITSVRSSDESLKTDGSNHAQVPEEGSDARATETTSMFANRINDELFVLYAPSDGLPHNMEIVFVHDLYTQGSRDAWRTTWTNDDGTCWPREFLGKKFPRSRILAVSYDACVITNSTQGRMDSLSIVAENLMVNFFLRSSNVGQTNNCPVVFVGHGLGCFVIKNLMLKACEHYKENNDERRKLLENVRGFVFYSPFNSGVQWDLYANESGQSNSLTDSLRPHNAELSRLNEAFASLRRRMQERRNSRNLWTVLTICESHETASSSRGRSQRSGTFVTEATARFDCEQFRFGVGDHFGVCKHQSTGDVGYQCVENWLDSILKSQRKPTPYSMPKFLPREPFMDPSTDKLPSYNSGESVLKFLSDIDTGQDYEAAVLKFFPDIDSPKEQAYEAALLKLFSDFDSQKEQEYKKYFR